MLKSYLVSEAALIVKAMKKSYLFVLSGSLIQLKNLLWVFTSVQDLPTQMLLLL